MDKKQKILLGTGIAAGVGVGGFVAFRLYVRSEARKVLVEQYKMDKAFTGLEVLEAASGKSWNLPTFEEFLEGITPVWALKMPDAAINDVLLKGRESDFWPEKYRQAVDTKTEQRIFALLRGASQADKETSIEDTLRTAAVALTEMLVSEKK
jgi:DNA transposition AAA+ family ATPase